MQGWLEKTVLHAAAGKPESLTVLMPLLMRMDPAERQKLLMTQDKNGDTALDCSRNVQESRQILKSLMPLDIVQDLVEGLANHDHLAVAQVARDLQSDRLSDADRARDRPALLQNLTTALPNMIDAKAELTTAVADLMQALQLTDKERESILRPMLLTRDRHGNSTLYGALAESNVTTIDAFGKRVAPLGLSDAERKGILFEALKAPNRGGFPGFNVAMGKGSSAAVAVYTEIVCASLPGAPALVAQLLAAKDVFGGDIAAVSSAMMGGHAGTVKLFGETLQKQLPPPTGTTVLKLILEDNKDDIVEALESIRSTPADQNANAAADAFMEFLGSYRWRLPANFLTDFDTAADAGNSSGRA